MFVMWLQISEKAWKSAQAKALWGGQAMEKPVLIISGGAAQSATRTLKNLQWLNNLNHIMDRYRWEDYDIFKKC